MTARMRLGRVILSLYPLAWRRRYAEEMLALLEQRPLGARAAVDLLRGVARAHVRPAAGLAELVAPAERMRNTVTAVALCWGVVVLAGAGFAKETEDQVFQVSGQAHPLLGILRDSITAIAVVAAVIVAVVGAPLLWWVARQAWRERRHDLLWRLALAPAALVVFAAVTAGLLQWLNTRPAPPRTDTAMVPIALGWLALGTATGLTCAYAPRLVLLRVRAPEALLRRAVTAAGALMACMFALTLATGAYGVELVLRVPIVAAQSGGPLSATTGEAVLAAALAMAGAAAAAALSYGRGRRVLQRR